MRPIRSDLHRFLCGLCDRGYSIVPQISRIYTDFFFYYILSADETYSVRLRRLGGLIRKVSI